MSYRIMDEPSPSPLARLTVNPFWPLLASMLAGTWLAWPWFALNSLSLGVGRRLYVDLAAIVGGFLATLVASLTLNHLLATSVLDQRGAHYAWLLPQAIRLTLLYLVYMREERTFQLFEHFGGRGANGMFPLILGVMARGPLLSKLPDSWALFLV